MKINKYKKLIICMLFFILVLLLESCDNKQQYLYLNNNFVLNKRTKKIHTEECSAVKKMSKKNRIDVSDTLLSLYKQKYVICKKCKAGIKKNRINSFVDEKLYTNLYLDDIKAMPTKEQYLDAIDKVGEWYVSHVPTYATRLQQETIKDYNGIYKNYKEYVLQNKNESNIYYVITSDINEKNISDLLNDENILMGTEEAVKNYEDNIRNIRFGSRIAYYPCELIEKSNDYNMAGDDCVRFIFAVFNKMYVNFTNYYQMFSNKKYSNTNSDMLTNDTQNIAYGLLNLGFEIYDKKENIVDVNNDKIPDGYISCITSDFKLKKGDILAREGHAHIYLGDGIMLTAPNFGWGRVYRNYPQQYTIKVIKNNNGNYNVVLVNGSGEIEHYSRIYRYGGIEGGEG